jgi:transposase InsO family protein
MSAVQISDVKLKEFREATINDPVLQKLKDTTIHGWPDESQHVPPEVRPYFTFRDEITYEEQLLFKGSRLIVPSTMRTDMLQRIHEAHMGIVKCKQLARDILYWPGMGAQIEDVVARCATCQGSRNAQPAEPMIKHDIPSRPWAKVASDLFKLRGKDYVLCVDYYSKYPDVSLLPDTSSRTTIATLKAMFGRFGVPDELITDNGPQYKSAEFEAFAKLWDFKHTTSSPGYAQSNGQIEKTVQTVKNLLKRCAQSGDDPTLALLNYRNTPLDGVGKSPAQLLMSRRLKSRLPTNSQLLKPELVESAQPKLIQRQNLQKYYYDKRAGRTQPTLKSGDTIRFKSPQGDWKLGRVQEKLPDTPRSYNVRSQTGKTYRRTRRHMFRTRETMIPQNGPRPGPTLANTHTGMNAVPAQAPEPNLNNITNRAPSTPIRNTPSVQNSPIAYENAIPQVAPTVTRSGRVVKPTQRLDL